MAKGPAEWRLPYSANRIFKDCGDEKFAERFDLSDSKVGPKC
jgi:hypothetical protein